MRTGLLIGTWLPLASWAIIYRADSVLHLVPHFLIYFPPWHWPHSDILCIYLFMICKLLEHRRHCLFSSPWNPSMENSMYLLSKWINALRVTARTQTTTFMFLAGRSGIVKEKRGPKTRELASEKNSSASPLSDLGWHPLGQNCVMPSLLPGRDIEKKKFV